MRHRPLLLILVLLNATSLWGGEQLSPTELVKRSSAVAEISIRWSTDNSAAPQISIENWLMTPDPKVLESLQADPKEKQKWLGACLPDAKLLEHWLTTYPHFDKKIQDLWRQALQQKNYRSIVFFRPHPATSQFRPTCETETLLVRSWQRHEEATQYRATIKAEILKVKRATPTKKKPPLSVPTTKLKSLNKPIQKQGCSCQ